MVVLQWQQTQELQLDQLLLTRIVKNCIPLHQISGLLVLVQLQICITNVPNLRLLQNYRDSILEDRVESMKSLLSFVIIYSNTGDKLVSILSLEELIPMDPSWPQFQHMETIYIIHSNQWVVDPLLLWVFQKPNIKMVQQNNKLSILLLKPSKLVFSMIWDQEVMLMQQLLLIKVLITREILDHIMLNHIKNKFHMISQLTIHLLQENINLTLRNRNSPKLGQKWKLLNDDSLQKYKCLDIFLCELHFAHKSNKFTSFVLPFYYEGCTPNCQGCYYGGGY